MPIYINQYMISQFCTLFVYTIKLPNRNTVSPEYRATIISNVFIHTL